LPGPNLHIKKVPMNVAVRCSSLALVSLLALLPLRQSRAQSVATNPVGYNVFNLYAGNNLRVNTFVQPTAYQSTFASYTTAANSVVTVSSSGSTLTSGSFNETGAEPSYFMEVLSGSSTGLIVDVVSNTASTVTVNANLANFSVSGTASFCIRPHTTLTALFPASTANLTAYVDSIQVTFPNGTTQSYLFTGTGDGWVNAGTFADAGAQVIYPGQGFVATVQSSKTVSVMGVVKPGPTIVPLYAGATNIVGNINPMVSGTQTLSSFDFPATFTAYVDSVQAFTDDGTQTTIGSYLSNGTNMVNAGTFADSDTLTVNSPNAVIVNVQNSKYWVMPSFYTSGN
jgi:hypothetical protein